MLIVTGFKYMGTFLQLKFVNEHCIAVTWCVFSYSNFLIATTFSCLHMIQYLVFLYHFNRCQFVLLLLYLSLALPISFESSTSPAKFKPNVQIFSACSHHMFLAFFDAALFPLTSPINRNITGFSYCWFTNCF